MTTALLDINSFLCFAHENLLTSELETWFADNKEADIVLAYLLYEYFPGTPELIAAMQCIREQAQKNNSKLMFLAEKFYEQFSDEWCGVESVYIDYWPLYVREMTKPVECAWNRNADKALFLTGKMRAMNRIGALVAAIKMNIIDRLLYSFAYSKPKFDKACMDIIALWGMKSDSLLDELKKKQGVTDLENTNIPSTRLGNKEFEFYAYIVDPSMFTSTRISLVSETEKRTIPVVTEKTWKAIAFRHPFVLLAIPGTHKHLSEMGIDSFDRIFPSIEEGTTISKVQVDKSLLNINWFLDHHELDDEVESIINHNYATYSMLAHRAFNCVTAIANLIDAPNLMPEIFNIMTDQVKALRKGLVTRALEEERSIRNVAWEKFYDEIKGTAWPTAVPFSDISSLPDWVLEEINSYDLSEFIPVLPPQSEIFLSKQESL